MASLTKLYFLLKLMTELLEIMNSPNPLPEGEGTLFNVIRYAGDRIKVAGDILDFTDFFMPDDTFPYDESAKTKRITEPPEAIPLLHEFRDELAKQDDFSHAALEQLMQRFIQSRSRKIADIIHALRVAVTGKSVGLGMFETLEILGKERVLRRIDRVLAR
jgi:glutamyl-tRNA synthetase